MTPLRFFFFYLFCLAGCVGTVQAARYVEAGAADPPPQEVAGVAIAVPPKPELESDRALDEGEGSGRRYDEATCNEYEDDFRDVCFQALARQRAPRDLEGALQACEEVVRDRLRFECMADAAELHVPTSLEDALEVCPRIPRRKWHDQCHFGIAMALVDVDWDEALEACERAGIWRDFCRHDVLGEIAVEDTDWVLEVCHRQEGDLLTRKTCWHGIGKYIGRVDLERAFAACEEVPLGPSNLYRENCVHGVGWAAGERFGAAGVAHCHRAGPQEDSCRLGVAFQLKALDPSAAVEICHRVERTDLEAHCLSFVGG